MRFFHYFRSIYIVLWIWKQNDVAKNSKKKLKIYWEDLDVYTSQVFLDMTKYLRTAKITLQIHHLRDWQIMIPCVVKIHTKWSILIKSYVLVKIFTKLFPLLDEYILFKFMRNSFLDMKKVEFEWSHHTNIKKKYFHNNQTSASSI